MAKRATFEELMEFCNKVREAGGGNPLDALMPAVPQDSTKCLVAKNLNFNCEVQGCGDGRWMMTVEDENVVRQLHEKLGLEYVTECDGIDNEYIMGLLLPDEIGQVARDFDAALDLASCMNDNIDREDDDYTAEKRQLVEAMWPYIEASVKEAYDLATLVNDDGSIVV